MPYLGVWAPREVSKTETIPKVPELGQGVRTPNWQQSQTQKVTGIRIRCQYSKQKINAGDRAVHGKNTPLLELTHPERKKLQLSPQPWF